MDMPAVYAEVDHPAVVPLGGFLEVNAFERGVDRGAVSLEEGSVLGELD